MSMRLTILKEIEAVAAEQQKTLVPLSDDLPLMDSGLDSLCFAILVARLEDVTGLDPFASVAGSRFPTTFGELVEFYERAPV
ncbi:MAG: phosphopantetheine-binding protein [Roseiarcus sp.]